jgi:hypothetical protein
VKISSMILTTLFVVCVLAACKTDQDETTATGTTGPGLQPQSPGGVLPDCPNGPGGHGASGCTKAEEGLKCQAHGPDVVLVCKSCVRLDEKTAATTAFVNPRCK